VTQNVSTGYERPTVGDTPGEATSTKDVAKDQAADVASSASEAGQHVAGVAKDQAGEVAAEAGRQVKDVFGQATSEINRQAGEQQQRVAGGLRSLGTELGSMAERSDESGVASDLARQASSMVHDAADWLEQRDPGTLLDEVKSFARRRPGMFLAVALGAGLAAGRLTRGLKDDASSSSGPAGGYPGAGAGYQGTGAGYTGTGASGAGTVRPPVSTQPQSAGTTTGAGAVPLVETENYGRDGEFEATYVESGFVEVGPLPTPGVPSYGDESYRDGEAR
jgi:hypothetical protein